MTRTWCLDEKRSLILLILVQRYDTPQRWQICRSTAQAKGVGWGGPGWWHGMAWHGNIHEHTRIGSGVARLVPPESKPVPCATSQLTRSSAWLQFWGTEIHSSCMYACMDGYGFRKLPSHGPWVRYGTVQCSTVQSSTCTPALTAMSTTRPPIRTLHLAMI